MVLVFGFFFFLFFPPPPFFLLFFLTTSSNPFSRVNHSKILCINCVIMYMGKGVQIYVLFVADMILYL